ncbi:hypothetical protein N8I77_010588 [Diaporthe amygdali]|uniref:Uncharacterized protein n=1 Tax=Phomopsis amygdali TaxID=1214568 RepID=A0AAD9S8B4_PHOAM|nr:hypothetical protein N8I77_010588 [Diaporthe amygdali]
MSDINQAGRPPAMKPFSYTSHTAQGQRPRRRTGSNSSASSAASAASAKSHEQFVFSPHQTPASEKEPFFSHQEYSGSQYPQTHMEVGFGWSLHGKIAAPAITSAVTMIVFRREH